MADPFFTIVNGRVVLPDRILDKGAVVVRGSRIEAVKENISCIPGAETVDAQGGYVMPGFIDIHLHGGGGVDFMDGTAAALRTVAAAHCAHGTTAMVPTTMTCPDEELIQLIGVYRQVKQKGTGSADFLGLHLEGPFFSYAARGAQPVGEDRTPQEEDVKRLLDLGGGKIIRWDAAPELPGMERFCRLITERGVMAAVAHTDAVATQAEAAFRWGFSHITHFYNAVTTFRKIRGRVYAGVVEAAYINDDVTIELIGDGHHIPRESMLLAHKIKGPDRIALITDAMRAAATLETRSVLGSLKTGVPVVVEDGVARLTDHSSYAGSICTMDHALRVAHLAYGLPLLDVSRMLSLTPARLCGAAARKGSLEDGKDADIVILDQAFNIQKVYVRGILRHSS